MRIVQISDTHLSLDVPSRRADMERCVAQVNALDPLPDVVIHTGDIVHDGLAEQYEVARSLLDQIRVPWFVLAGNKDNRAALRDTFADCGFLRPDAPFIQYAVDSMPVRLVCLDTLDEASNKGALCQARLDDLALLLAQAPDRPTAVFMHHPPYDVPVAPEALQFGTREEADACLKVLHQHDNIRGLFCGHVHRPSVSQLGPIPATVMTAVATDLRYGEARPIALDAPLFTLHQFDTHTGQFVTESRPAAVA